MRQAGILAAAGRHAVDHHLARLADDHANAAALAAGLSTLTGLVVTAQHTNMVFVERLTADDTPAGLGEGDGFSNALEASGVRTTGGKVMRLVCHLDVAAEDVTTVVDAFRRALKA